MCRIEDNQRLRGPAAQDLNLVEIHGANLCKQLFFKVCKKPLHRVVSRLIVRRCKRQKLADCGEVWAITELLRKTTPFPQKMR